MHGTQKDDAGLNVFLFAHFACHHSQGHPPAWKATRSLDATLAHVVSAVQKIGQTAAVLIGISFMVLQVCCRHRLH